MLHFPVFLVLSCVIACTVGSGTHSTDTEDVYKPCGSSYPVDKECVRQFFAEHGSCSVVTQSDDEPVMKRSNLYNIAFMNVTAIDKNTTLINLGGVIERFYINNETENLIMSIKMQNVSYSTPEMTFYFHRIGQEPLVITDAFGKSYPDHVFTATIPLRNGKVTVESMQDSIISAFVLQEGTFALDLGPKILESEDPVVRSSFASVEGREDLLLKETFVTDGFLRFLASVQKHICDFGMPV